MVSGRRSLFWCKNSCKVGLTDTNEDIVATVCSLNRGFLGHLGVHHQLLEDLKTSQPMFSNYHPKKIHGKTGIFAYMESLYVFKSRCRYITVLRSRRDFSHLISTFEFHQPAPLMQGYISRDDFRRAMKASDVRMSKMATWRCKSGSHGEIRCPWTQGRNHWMLDMVGRPAI